MMLPAIVTRLYKHYKPPTSLPNSSSPSSSKPLKFGILGAAKIAPNALITPARTHSDVQIYAVAARSLDRAREFAAKHGIEKAYGNYQELLDDGEVDVVYNPLPNSLHYEWTMKALRAGKHVLNEKPTADTADEAATMFDYAASKGLVLLDGYHYRFHPALLRVKEIVDSEEIGKLTRVEATMIIGKGLIKDGDIRYMHEFGGGALMDLGCYTMNVILYMSSSMPESVTEASCQPYVAKNASPDVIRNVDRQATATLALANGATAYLDVDLSAPAKYGVVPNFSLKFKVEGENGSVEMSNFIMPTLLHTITVKLKDGKSRTEKVYKPKDGEGEDWWSTYRYQLEALVDKIRGKEPKTWLTKEESVATMEWVEKTYEKNGLGSRPKSSYVLQE